MSGFDQQPLLETGGMRDDDIEIPSGCRANDRARRTNDDAHGNRGVQRIEQRQRPRLLDGRRRAEAQGRCLRAGGASGLDNAGKGECDGASRHVPISSKRYTRAAKSFQSFGHVAGAQRESQAFFRAALHRTGDCVCSTRPLVACLCSCSLRGAVAQLGEHLVCNQGVVGSNPIRSITRIFDVGFHRQTNNPPLASETP